MLPIKTIAVAAALSLGAFGFAVPVQAAMHDHHDHDRGGIQFSFGVDPYDAYDFYDQGYQPYYRHPEQQVCGWVWQHHHRNWECWWE